MTDKEWDEWIEAWETMDEKERAEWMKDWVNSMKKFERKTQIQMLLSVTAIIISFIVMFIMT